MGALDDNTEQNKERKRSRITTILNEGMDGYTIVSVRLRNAEFLEFSEQVKKAGLSNNRAMRIAARRVAGFLELEPESQKALKDTSFALGDIAANINQLARNSRKSETLDIKDFMDARQELGREMAQLQSKIQLLLSIAKRRQDGIARLEEASL